MKSIIVKMHLQTYGEHREKLELKNDWLKILKKNETFNVKFMCTPFDESSLNLLEEIGVDAIRRFSIVEIFLL